ncbi:patr class I histocompatibility antigen, B-1 alpha chain-like [Protobothrops mucrosquamatus]|uniref:patr class I histocompatibility antigen, B-1 alpha chain-like n=1 Tax=Protobothrops mucrosquamatus TaxID=103944 RepID=UPI000775EE69|nr:patr class I histocompatibility antigen, B-1 alpha chain-like [Protobothrops mucrosquamatus]
MALRSFSLLALVVAVRESCFELCPSGSLPGASSHSLKYFYSSILEPSQGLPHFVAVGYVDGQVFAHYDSNSRRMEPRVSWIGKVGMEDPQYWDRNTQRERSNEETSRENLEIARTRYNQSEVTQRKLNAIAGLNERRKAYLEEICIEWLEKYLSYGKETLLRTEPPEVTMSSKTEMEDGMETHVCRLDGFYPREIDASWTRDGEVWLQDTLRGSVAPNADGTFHAWLSIRIDPKERGRYRCHVEHDGLEEPLDVALKEPKSNLGLILGCVLAGLLLVGVTVGILAFLNKRQEGYRAASSG